MLSRLAGGALLFVGICAVQMLVNYDTVGRWDRACDARALVGAAALAEEAALPPCRRGRPASLRWRGLVREATTPSPAWRRQARRWRLGLAALAVLALAGGVWLRRRLGVNAIVSCVIFVVVTAWLREATRPRLPGQVAPSVYAAFVGGAAASGDAPFARGA